MEKEEMLKTGLTGIPIKNKKWVRIIQLHINQENS